MSKPTPEQRAAVLHAAVFCRRKTTIARLLGLSTTCVEQALQIRYARRSSINAPAPDPLDVLERDRYLTKRGVIP